MIEHGIGSSGEADRKSVLRKALSAIDSLQAELDAIERSRSEAIAVVGLACRFPGAPNARAYWSLLRDGVDAVRELPADRWDKEFDSHSNAISTDSRRALYGGFLDRVDLFDAAFFGISGREAESMDPQQRLVLEVTWEALENAGIAPSSLRGSSTGVFIGITVADYARLATLRNPANLDVYTATGGALNVAAGRVSYVLGLNGPAMAVDTACSSSLVGLHLACQSLRARETDLALAGGVNLLLTPEPFICFEKWGMMAPDGRCKTFDEKADGFVRGEGCGVVALKRVSDALAAGDRILALIRGTAVNQDGASSGLTVPNGLAQEAVIRAALKAARLQPEDIDYVEAHGTGTTLGDPIELEALGAVLGRTRPPEKPLIVGSAKTNIGHLESASGLAGLIKVILALQEETIPSQLHFRKLNPRIALGKSSVQIAASPTPWRRTHRSRIAGVSSFGFSGTNAHVIVQEAPAQVEPKENQGCNDRSEHLLVLSAESQEALRELSRCYAEHLAADKNVHWPDVCHTAAVGRSALSHRLALSSATASSAIVALGAFADNGRAPDALFGRGRAGLKVAFLFSGSGAQHADTASTFYRSEPVFRGAIDRCAAAFRGFFPQSLQDILGYGGRPQPALTSEAQKPYAAASLFAVEYALTALWRSWGVEPAGVMGQGVGEYVAACVAGKLSLEDALRLVALNMPLGSSSCCETPAGEVESEKAGIDLASTVTGSIIEPSDILSPGHWGRLACETPQTDAAIRALAGRGIRVFLEIGPAPHLFESARQLLNDPAVTWLASMLPQQDVWHQTLLSLGALFVLGLRPAWVNFDKPYRRKKVALPSYPFQRQRFWLPPPELPTKAPTVALSPKAHPMLGLHVPLASEPGTHIWHGEISLTRCPWLIDHQVQGAAVVPATAFIELALAAAAQTLGSPPFVLSEIEIQKVLRLDEGLEFNLQTRFQRQRTGGACFEIFSRPKHGGETWTRHAIGRVSIGTAKPSSPKLDPSMLEAIRQRCADHLEGSEFYRLHQQRGNDWGPTFQGVRSIWRGQGEALSEVEAPVAFQNELHNYQFHPAVSDASGHVLTATVPLDKVTGKRDGAFVGAGIEEIRFYRHPEGDRLYAHARIRQGQALPENVLVGDVQVYDQDLNLVSETLGARLWYLESGTSPGILDPVDDWLYEPTWLDKPAKDGPPGRTACTGTWVIFTDGQGIGDALGAQLRARGARCLMIHRSESTFHANGAVAVRPEVLEDYLEALSAAGPSGTVRGVVHLWSLDITEPEGGDLRALANAQICGPVSVLRLVQALEKSNVPEAAKLWLVTRGAQPAGRHASSLSLFQSPLWGLGRTIGAEHSDLWGGQVDLDPSDAPDTAARLLLEHVANPEGEDQVAFRDGVRRVLRLTRQKATNQPPSKLLIRPDASYLITGGLGGLGMALARWLAAQGAKSLVLAGRTPLPARAEWERLSPDTREARCVETIDDLERKGVAVQTISVDVGDERGVSLLLEKLRANQRFPLRGVIHAAGVMQYQPLASQTPEQMRELLVAKMTGGWLLHRELADASLDFFVLFSSSSSLLSSPLMGSYSAANAFLDALAHHRSALGLPGLSINWGTWSETGMATRFAQDRKLDRHGRSGATKGIGTLTTKQALSAFARLLGSTAVQAGVMPINWQEWGSAYGHLTSVPYLSLVRPDPESIPERAHTDEATESISAAPAAKRPELLEAYLARSVSRILKVPLSSLDPERSISSLGFDSLMSLELRTQLEKDLAVKIAMARLLEGPTLVELKEWLLHSLDSAQDEVRQTPAPVTGAEWEEGQI